jgi:hypothetical protein
VCRGEASFAATRARADVLVPSLSWRRRHGNLPPESLAVAQREVQGQELTGPCDGRARSGGSLAEGLTRAKTDLTFRQRSAQPGARAQTAISVRSGFRPPSLRIFPFCASVFLLRCDQKPGIATCFTRTGTASPLAFFVFQSTTSSLCAVELDSSIHFDREHHCI